jgi:hypothetical protein
MTISTVTLSLLSCHLSISQSTGTLDPQTTIYWVPISIHN